jgi:hypothetical protein
MPPSSYVKEVLGPAFTKATGINVKPASALLQAQHAEIDGTLAVRCGDARRARAPFHEGDRSRANAGR